MATSLGPSPGPWACGNHRLALKRIKTPGPLAGALGIHERGNHRLALKRIKTWRGEDVLEHLNQGGNHRLALKRIKTGQSPRPALPAGDVGITASL